MNEREGVEGMVKGIAEERPVSVFVIVHRPRFAGSWVKVDFEHYGITVGRKHRGGLRFGYGATLCKCYI